MLEVNDRAAQTGTPAIFHLYIVRICVERNWGHFRVLGIFRIKTCNVNSA